MELLFRLCSRWPLGVAHACGWVLGWLSWALSATYRRRFAANVRTAGLTSAQARAAVGAAGRQVTELPRLWFGAPVPVQWDGAGHVEAALAVGRGIVFLTPHLGCFEVTAQAYASRYGCTCAGKPMTVLYRPPRKAWLAPLVANARARPGLATAPTSVSGVKQLIRALKNGECVGLLPDQVPPLGQGVWAPFFGRPAYTMSLAARLVQQTGAIPLMAWGERLQGNGGYVVHVLPMPEPLPSGVEAAVGQINTGMEGLICTRPEQYLWGYARYKAPQVQQDT
ncbi:MAG: hypothetical protein RLZZ126_512 [Pseudomonadota bacterium]|jgi:Kdo2-lipid IVA lauroyltransferase/acyltransferase